MTTREAISPIAIGCDDKISRYVNADAALMLPARDDVSTVVAECHTSHYSASALARAVEDVDAHLVDLLTNPSDRGTIHITLRFTHRDPSAVVRSLERYGYDVLEANAAHGATPHTEQIAQDRLRQLYMFLNV